MGDRTANARLDRRREHCIGRITVGESRDGKRQEGRYTEQSTTIDTKRRNPNYCIERRGRGWDGGTKCSCSYTMVGGRGYGNGGCIDGEVR